MIPVLKTAFEIDYNYKINAFIYCLKKIPLLGKIIPSDLYKKEDIKRGVRILYIIICTILELLKKFAYVGVFIYLAFNREINTNTFLLVFMMLTLLGSIVNAQILAPQSKKYYTVLLMGMDAKEYVTAHTLFFLVKTVLAFLPVLIFFMCVKSINPLWSLPLLLFMLMSKIIGEYIGIRYYNKYKKTLSNNPYVNIVGIVIAFGAAYGLIHLGVPYISIILIFVLLVCVFPAIKCAEYILTYPHYRRLYKEAITLNKIVFDADSMKNESRRNQVKINKKDIELGDEIKRKSGYAYFNTIFFKRHSGILLRSAYTWSLISLGIALCLCIAMTLQPDIKIHMNKMIMNWLPYFVFIMYIINRGAVITQAMFINCDNSMLSYNFYRTPTTILNVFKTRIKTVVLINLLPSLMIASALPILLFLSGGTSNPLTYVSLFLSIIFMSIFFSVHHLILYYLLQPYDINMKAKSSTYNIANSITYFMCYMSIRVHVDTTIFSVGTILLAAIYIVIALVLVYKYAPKTFRLK